MEGDLGAAIYINETTMIDSSNYFDIQASQDISCFEIGLYMEICENPTSQSINEKIHQTFIQNIMGQLSDYEGVSLADIEFYCVFWMTCDVLSIF